MGLTDDPGKKWLLDKACKALDVSEAVCETLLSEDQAQLDLASFLKGGRRQLPFVAMLAQVLLVERCVSSQALALLF